MRPRAVPGLRRRELPDGESVVLQSEAGRAVVLNALGTVVLELCDGRLRSLDIVRLISERFADVQAERIAADVERFIRDLADNGMLEDLDACGSEPSER